MRKSTMQQIAQIASEVGDLECSPERRCSFAADSDPLEMGWPHSASNSWCASCLVYWHLCEARDAIHDRLISEEENDLCCGKFMLQCATGDPGCVHCGECGHFKLLEEAAL